MGQAFDREGRVLAESYGPTKAEVLRELERKAPDAAEVRIRSLAAQCDQVAGSAQDTMLSEAPWRSGEELSLDNIEDAMKYQPWHLGQQQQGEAVREALVMAAKAILRNVPRSPRRTLALQHLISARMDANCAISFAGRF